MKIKNLFKLKVKEEVKFIKEYDFNEFKDNLKYLLLKLVISVKKYDEKLDLYNKITILFDDSYEFTTVKNKNIEISILYKKNSPSSFSGLLNTMYGSSIAEEDFKRESNLIEVDRCSKKASKKDE